MIIWYLGLAPSGSGKSNATHLLSTAVEIYSSTLNYYLRQAGFTGPYRHNIWVATAGHLAFMVYTTCLADDQGGGGKLSHSKHDTG